LWHSRQLLFKKGWTVFSKEELPAGHTHGRKLRMTKSRGAMMLCLRRMHHGFTHRQIRFQALGQRWHGSQAGPLHLFIGEGRILWPGRRGAALPLIGGPKGRGEPRDFEDQFCEIEPRERLATGDMKHAVLLILYQV